MSTDLPIGVAFVGLGWWGEVLAEAALNSGAVKVTGGFARTPASRQTFVLKFGGRNFDSFDDLLADSETEAVVIASANSVHKDQAISAARAGKHVHLEKPMTLSVSDAKEVVATCANAGVKLHVGQNFRRWPMFRRAKRALETGEVGTVSLAFAHFSHSLGLTAGEKSMRWDPVENPGGPLYSYTIHLADLMEHLFGEVLEVEAMCAKVGGPSSTDDAASALLRFKSGLMGMLLSSYLAPLRFSFDILGTKASLSLSSERMPKLQADEELMENAPVLDVGCDFTKGRDIANREQFTDLAKCIRQGGEPEVTGVHGVRALAIMRAMLRSHAERRLVSLEEILEND